MSNELKQASAIVDSLPADTSQKGVNQESKPLSGLNRQLTEDDLKSPGVRKLLLGQLDEYETCKNKLSETMEIFHIKDKETAVLSEKLKSYVCFDWIYTCLLSVGSILVGYYASQPSQGLILLGLGIGSLLFAFYLKYKNSHESKNDKNTRVW